MSDIITVRTYSGCYGGETTNIGDIIVTTINCPTYEHSLSHKQIIFVVDESGSMLDTIKTIQASLFVTRNAILKLEGYNVNNLDENARDQIFTRCCNSCIITFSEDAKCRWESTLALGHEEITTFSDAVLNISAESSTNMGDALKLAFSKKDPNCVTWIILFTDGMSNRGPCQTIDSFKNIMNEIPIHTKVIPLGFTTNFDPDILSVIGAMTYIETEENIPEIFGGIVGEIVTCYGFDAIVTLPSLSNNYINPDDIIIVPDIINERPRDAIGSNRIGCLFNERKFIHGYLPWGNHQREEFAKYVGLLGTLSYFDILSRSMVNIEFTVNRGEEIIPDEVYENYFLSSKGRILLDIYQSRKSKIYINSIKNKISDWKHRSAIPHKEEILRILDNRRGKKYEILSNALCTQNQTSYTTTGRHATSFQQSISTYTTLEAKNYSNIVIDTSKLRN